MHRCFRPASGLLIVLALAASGLWAQDDENNGLDDYYTQLSRERAESYDSELFAAHRELRRSANSNVVPEGADPVVSLTMLRAPRKAVKSFRKAIQLAAKGKYLDARKQLENAVLIYPQFGAAWCGIGEIQSLETEYDAARESFRKAMGSDPSFWPSYHLFAEMEIGLSRWVEAAEVSQQGIEAAVVPVPLLHIDLATASFHLRRFSDVIASADYCIPDRCPAKIHHLYGLTLYQLGDLARSAEELRTFLRKASEVSERHLVQQQLAQVESRLAEQGR